MNLGLQLSQAVIILFFKENKAVCTSLRKTFCQLNRNTLMRKALPPSAVHRRCLNGSSFSQ